MMESSSILSDSSEALGNTAPHPPHSSGDSSNPWVNMPTSARYALLAGLCVFGLVSVVGALLNTPQNPSSPFLAFSDFVYLVALAYPLFRYDKKKDGWLHPLVFSTLWTILRVLPRRLSFFINGLEEHAVLALSAEDLTRLVAYENLLNALALICTYVGFYTIKKPWVPRLPLRQPKNIWITVVIAGVLSLGALFIYVRLSGSLSQHFLNLSLNSTAKVFDDEVTGVGQLITIAEFFSVALIISIGYRPHVVRKPTFWAAALIAITIVYLATGKRSIVLAPIIVGSITWMLATRQVPVGKMLIAGLLTICAFVSLTVVREASNNAKSLTDVTAAAADFQAGSALANSASELSYRLGGYSSVYPILHYVPDESPLLWGESYLVIIGRPIPRSIWPTKPRGTDFRAGATFFGATWGIPPGGVAEAYWNFHIPGIIAVYFLFGVFYRWIANLYLTNSSHGVVTYIYAYTVLNVTPTENVITNWLQTILLIAFFTAASGALGSRRAASS